VAASTLKARFMRRSTSGSNELLTFE
jgi:hypothetical protein